MLSRREVLAGGLAGTVARDLRTAEEQDAAREGQREIAHAVQAVERTLDRSFNSISLGFDVVAVLRRNFDAFIKSNGKFPDFCDIGLNVFPDVYDWHVRNRQQIVVTRQVDGRYTIQFMFTSLVLRQEHEVNYIGYPYDKA